MLTPALSILVNQLSKRLLFPDFFFLTDKKLSAWQIDNCIGVFSFIFTGFSTASANKSDSKLGANLSIQVLKRK